jgi:hypothetical protein
MFRVLLSAAILLLACAPGLRAADSAEGRLALDGSIAPNGSAVELRWLDARPPRVGTVTVSRRFLGQMGATTWQPVSPGPGAGLRFIDEGLLPGIAYEYRVIRSDRDIVDVGYWATGVALPAVEARGTAHVVVDESVLPEIAARLARFERDLTGDGWQVERHTVARGEARASRRNLEKAIGIRNLLRERYLADPFGTHVAILVGHVPVVHSGLAAPDGHKPVPLPSDLFYADMDGTWGVTQEGLLADNRVPGDFIEMQIGCLCRQRASSLRTPRAAQHRRSRGGGHRRASRRGRSPSLALGRRFRGAGRSALCCGIRQQGGLRPQLRQWQAAV